MRTWGSGFFPETCVSTILLGNSKVMGRNVRNRAEKLVGERARKNPSVVKINSSALGSPISGAPYFVWLIFFLPE